jgi:hypothetical protein
MEPPVVKNIISIVRVAASGREPGVSAGMVGKQVVMISAVV